MNTAPAPSCRMLAPVSWVSWAAELAPAPLPCALCTMQPPVRITSDSHCLALSGRLNRIWNVENTKSHIISFNLLACVNGKSCLKTSISKHSDIQVISVVVITLRICCQFLVSLGVSSENVFAVKARLASITREHSGKLPVLLGVG